MRIGARSIDAATTAAAPATTFVAGLLALSCALSPVVPPAIAAIPSISEYDAVQYKAKAPPAPTDAETAATLPSAADGLRALRTDLQTADRLVENGQLEDVRALLRTPLFSRFLGYSPGIRGGAANLRPAAALVKASVSAEPLGELLLDLQRLDEFCLSNRVIVFNVEDLEQVRALMAAPTRAPEERFDKAEVRALLEDAKQHLAEAEAALIQ